ERHAAEDVYPLEGRLARPWRGSAPGHAFGAAAAACGRALAAGAGAMAGGAGESADGAGGGKSGLAGIVWPRDRAHVRGFRHAGGEAEPSRTARLAGGRISRTACVEHEADGAADGNVGDVPAIVEGAAGTRGERSGQYAAGAAIGDAAFGGIDPR